MLLKLCHVDICSPQKTFRVFNICLFLNILGKKLKNPKKMKTFSFIFGGIFQFLTGDNAIDYPRALFKRGDGGDKPFLPLRPPLPEHFIGFSARCRRQKFLTIWGFTLNSMTPR
jgi:hypothetical protein